MEIENAEGRQTLNSKQRLFDAKKQACFLCHEVGYRP